MAETVEDLNQLREMLHHFDTLHIAFQDDDCPYIVPMNFGIGEVAEQKYIKGELVVKNVISLVI